MPYILLIRKQRHKSYVIFMPSIILDGESSRYFCKTFRVGFATKYVPINCNQHQVYYGTILMHFFQ